MEIHSFRTFSPGDRVTVLGLDQSEVAKVEGFAAGLVVVRFEDDPTRTWVYGESILRPVAVEVEGAWK